MTAQTEKGKRKRHRTTTNQLYCITLSMKAETYSPNKYSTFVSRMSAAERLRLLVLLHGLCWIGSLCLTTLLPGYMSRICGQTWPADCRLQRFQPFSIETSRPLTALQHMQLRLLLRKGSLRLSTLWPRLNNALQNLTPAFWNCLVGQEGERVHAEFYLALKTSCCTTLQNIN